MPNTCRRHCGLHSGAEQINNMMDYERCSLVQLINCYAAEMQRHWKEKPIYMKENNILNSNSKHLS